MSPSMYTALINHRIFPFLLEHLVIKGYSRLHMAWQVTCRNIRWSFSTLCYKNVQKPIMTQFVYVFMLGQDFKWPRLIFFWHLLTAVCVFCLAPRLEYCWTVSADIHTEHQICTSKIQFIPWQKKIALCLLYSNCNAKLTAQNHISFFNYHFIFWLKARSSHTVFNKSSVFKIIASIYKVCLFL